MTSLSVMSLAGFFMQGHDVVGFCNSPHRSLCHSLVLNNSIQQNYFRISNIHI